jgi:hypothetical protein
MHPMLTSDSYTNQELTSWFMLLMNRAAIENLANYTKGFYCLVSKMACELNSLVSCNVLY